jgi:ABC-type multidrug transport system fused ATPase/permease subunit
MQRNSQYRFGGSFSLIIGLLVFFLIFYIFTMAIKFLWQLALILMPVLLIATFIINRSLIINYVKNIGNIYKRNKTNGLIAGGLSIIGSPLVTLFLFGQAMLFRKINTAKTKEQEANNSKFGEYIDYEEVDTSFRRLINEQPKQKKTIEIIESKEKKQPKKEEDNPYDALWYWVLSLVPNTIFFSIRILTTKSSKLSTNTQYPIPNTQYPIPNTQYPIPI